MPATILLHQNDANPIVCLWEDQYGDHWTPWHEDGPEDAQCALCGAHITHGWAAENGVDVVCTHHVESAQRWTVTHIDEDEDGDEFVRTVECEDEDGAVSLARSLESERQECVTVYCDGEEFTDW